MVAARDLNPLEVILKEYPAVVGPYSNTLPGCLQVLHLIHFFLPALILNLQNNDPSLEKNTHTFPIYDECQTQSANVSALP